MPTPNDEIRFVLTALMTAVAKTDWTPEQIENFMLTETAKLAMVRMQIQEYDFVHTEVMDENGRKFKMCVMPSELFNKTFKEN